MKTHLAILPILLMGQVTAQTTSLSLSEGTRLLAKAQSTLLIYAPAMRNPEVTASYRKAIGNRVAATIVTSPEAVRGGGPTERVMQVAFAGYDTGVTAVYAPTIQNVKQSVPFVVVDNAYALVGWNLVSVPLPGDDMGVKLVRDPKTVASLSRWVVANARANPKVDLLRWFGRHFRR